MSRPARTFFSASAWTWPWICWESSCERRWPRAARVLQDLHLHHAALLLDERGRDLDRVLLVELLDDLLGDRGVRLILEHLLELRVHVGPELDERLEVADVLGELVVERRQDALLDVASPSRGTRVLAAQIFTRVVRRRTWPRRRTCRRRSCRRARRRAPASTWPEPSSSCTPSAAAVLELLAVDVEGEVDGHDVALLRGARGLGRLERARAACAGARSARRPACRRPPSAGARARTPRRRPRRSRAAPRSAPCT